MKNLGKNLKLKKSNIPTDEKETFCMLINLLESTVDRNQDLFDKHQIDMINYDELFYVIIKNLFTVYYSDWKADIIFWYVIERKGENDEIYPLEWYNETTEITKEIIIKTPEQLWDVLKSIENNN